MQPGILAIHPALLQANGVVGRQVLSHAGRASLRRRRRRRASAHLPHSGARDRRTDHQRAFAVSQSVSASLC